MKIVLATKSPYRREMMEYTGFDFITDPAEIEERFEGRPSEPRELVLLLSKLKAEAVAKKHANALVIGFDSAGYFQGEFIEKPKNYEEAFQRLKKLSGKTHYFYSGITIINTETGKVYQKVAVSKITYRILNDNEIKLYLEEENGKYMTIALGYDPMHIRGGSFIKEIEGDPNDIYRGFPFSCIIELIKEAKGDTDNENF